MAITCYAGIDPGKSGGIAWIVDGEAHAEKLPATRRDAYELLQHLECMGSFCLIEKLRGIPTIWDPATKTYKLKSKPSSFGTLMLNYGVWLGQLSSTTIRYDEVSPAKWQRAMGIEVIKGERDTDKKNRHKALAQQLFPGLRITHAIADALLIAEYGRRMEAQYGGQ